jgi:hypothetical protein
VEFATAMSLGCKSITDLGTLIVTGLFCAQLIKAFIYIQFGNIPSDYIMKRYTRDARSMVPWDRHDVVTTGSGCESDQYKTKRLVEIAMAPVRSLRKTSMGFQKGCEKRTALAEWGETIAASTRPSNMLDCMSEQNDGIDETRDDPQSSGQMKMEEIVGEMDLMLQLSEFAPKEARTKGRKRGGKQVVNDDTSSSKSQGKRSCSYCGALGHYSTGCPINPENTSKK